MSRARRFPSCRRGASSLEGVLASIPLLLCLGGIFEIVQTVFTGDLLKRAAYQVARSNALASSAASDAADLEARIKRAIETEVGDWLDFDLTMSSTCPPPEEGQTAAEYCLSAKMQVYDSAGDMAPTTENPNGQLSSEAEAALGGGSNAVVVVRLTLKPRSALGQLQHNIFGSGGLRSIAIMRNEERI